MNRNRVATWLCMLNLAAATLHCLDNVIYFSDYPEPDWITGPGFVYFFYTIGVVLIIAGYVAFRARRRLASALGLSLFSLISLSALGHYAYAPLSALSLKMNTLILFEAVMAVALLGFVVYSQLVWNKVSAPQH